MPSAGVQAFGGDCANALDLAALSDLSGSEFELVEPAWRSGAEGLQGGLVCWFGEIGAESPRLTLQAYPANAVPSDALPEGSSCTPEGFCVRSGAVGETWLWMTSRFSMGGAVADSAWAQAVASAERYPAPVAAPRTASWWETPSCDRITAALDMPTRVGVPVEESVASEPEPGATFSPYTLPASLGGVTECHYMYADQTTSRHFSASVHVIPGGGAFFDEIAAADGAEAVDVPGALAAVAVPDAYVYEGYHPPLVVTDGANIVVVAASWDLVPDPMRIPMATAVLAVMTP